MSESKKIVRIFILFVVWIVFVAATLTGIVTAAEKTEYIFSGKEAETVHFSKNE